ILKRTSANEVKPDYSAQWGENLSVTAARALAENLERMTPSDDILMLPSRSRRNFDYIVNLDLSRFESDAQGRSVLEGRWSISEHDGTELASGRARRADQAAGPGYDAMAAAMSRNLAAVSADIAHALRGASPAPQREFRGAMMLAEAEVGHQVAKPAFAKAVPGLREALIDAQFQLTQSRRFAAIMILSGVSGAGKSEAVSRLLTWMDPRYIDALAIGRDESDEQRLRPYMWRFWQILPPKGRITILFEHWYTLPVRQHALNEISDAELGERLAEINRFEQMLTNEDVL